VFSQAVLPYFLIPPPYQRHALFSFHIYDLLIDVCKLLSRLLVQWWWWHSTHEHAATILSVKVKVQVVCSSERLVPMVGVKLEKVCFNFSGVRPLMLWLAVLLNVLASVITTVYCLYQQCHMFRSFSRTILRHKNIYLADKHVCKLNINNMWAHKLYSLVFRFL
jgi:hypothetical protein